MYRSWEVFTWKIEEQWIKDTVDLLQTAIGSFFPISKDLHNTENKHGEMFEIEVFPAPYDVLFSLTKTR